MSDVSDIEDGFALKRRGKNTRTRGKKQRRAPRGEHTVPPPPAKHILGSFTLANPTSKRAVSDYVETQDCRRARRLRRRSAHRDRADPRDSVDRREPLFAFSPAAIAGALRILNGGMTPIRP